MALSDREKAVFLIAYNLHQGSFAKSARDGALSANTTYAGASITALVQECQSTFLNANGVPYDQNAFTPAAVPVEPWS